MKAKEGFMKVSFALIEDKIYVFNIKNTKEHFYIEWFLAKKWLKLKEYNRVKKGITVYTEIPEVLFREVLKNAVDFQKKFLRENHRIKAFEQGLKYSKLIIQPKAVGMRDE